MSVKDWFNGRTMIIATRHQKEEVMAPLLESQLGCSCRTPVDLDTDQLGTFSGEVVRKYNPIEAARKKCMMALADEDGDLCIASEGSFGPHPSLPFCEVDEELVLMLDARNGFEIVASKISFDTNFSGSYISNTDDLRTFAEKALFPSHALIVRKAQDSTAGMVKGINTWETLQDAYKKVKEKWGQAYVETDMRAMHNPLRMEAIKAATQRLIEKLQHECPRCKAPGFAVTKQIAGLPCSLCSQATKSILVNTYTCQQCHFEEDISYPQNKMSEDPMYCDYCNP